MQNLSRSNTRPAPNVSRTELTRNITAGSEGGLAWTRHRQPGTGGADQRKYLLWHLWSTSENGERASPTYAYRWPSQAQGQRCGNNHVHLFQTLFHTLFQCPLRCPTVSMFFGGAERSAHFPDPWCQVSVSQVKDS